LQDRRLKYLKPLHHRLSNEKGAAIIVALFITALVAALAFAMIERVRNDTRRTELLINANQAYFLAQGSVAYAMDQLNNNLKNKTANKLVDTFPMHNVSEQENATITTDIVDAQSFFNINNISDTNYKDDFARLIKNAVPNIDPNLALHIMLGALDWISAGMKGSEFDRYYAELKPAYIAPHRVMMSASELRVVKGMTAAIYSQLEPYLIALPVVTPVNINTASPILLMSLSKTMSFEAAKSLATYRIKTPFITTDQFVNFDIVKNNPIEKSKITVESQYFLIKTEVAIGDQHLILFTLVQRLLKDNKPITIPFWQTKGTL
jgi:general secretion pathway protein K